MINKDKVMKALKKLSKDERQYFAGYNMAEVKKQIGLQELAEDTLALLKEQDWVKCSNRMPEEHETIFAKFKGTEKWSPAMFAQSSDDVRVVIVFADGTRRVSHSHTIDGKWECEKSPVKRTVTHWMPNPGLPEEGQ